MKIQILGTGCAKCKKLAELADKAAKELELDYELVKVHDMAKIISYGVMITPALLVNGELKFSGRVPDINEIKKYLKN